VDAIFGMQRSPQSRAAAAASKVGRSCSASPRLRRVRAQARSPRRPAADPRPSSVARLRAAPPSRANLAAASRCRVLRKDEPTTPIDLRSSWRCSKTVLAMDFLARFAIQSGGMDQPTNALEVEHVSRSYGSRQAVSDLSL